MGSTMVDHLACQWVLMMVVLMAANWADLTVQMKDSLLVDQKAIYLVVQ